MTTMESTAAPGLAPGLILPVPSLEDLTSALAYHERILEQSRRRLEVLLKESASAKTDVPQIQAFIRKPWCILPKAAAQFWVIVPSWSSVHAGWLHSTTESYRVYVVDRYTQWFGGELPAEMREELAMPAAPAATVSGGILTSTAPVAETVQSHVDLTAPVKKGAQWRVRPGHEFELLAQLIEMGALPFAPQPVQEKHLRKWSPLKGPVATLRDYQRAAWSEFLAYGALGVYWPMSLGKTVIAAYAIARLAGPKLVIAGETTTLVEQWKERLEAWLGPTILPEVDVVTYHGYARIAKAKKTYTLLVADEAHALPADTFSRFSTVPAIYRLGLSATPLREDGRTNYIMALTGRPHGNDWAAFMRQGLLKPPDVRVRILRTLEHKIRAAIEEIGDVAADDKRGGGRRLVFCDSLDLGRTVAQKLGCPFVSGETKDRLEILRANPVCVVSRVGDQGLSLPDLFKVVEIDFHHGSRRQELQRVGRLFHRDAASSRGRGEHVLLMTAPEFAAYRKRLWALEEKDIRVKLCDETKR